MEFHLLRIFTAVVEERSLTKAGNRLATVQSNVSARLKQLERELGCRLLSRTRQGMVPTGDGERLYARARELLEREEKIVQEMRRAPAAGPLVVGTPETFLRSGLSRALSRWLRKRPEAKVRVRTGFSPAVAGMLEDRSVDLGVVIGRRRPAGLRVLRRIDEELCVATPRAVREVSASALAGLQPMLLGDSCFFGQSLLQLYRDLGLVSERHEYLFSIEAILECVALGLGTSVFPLGLLEGHRLAGRIAVHDFPGRSRFSYFVACHPARGDDRLIREFARDL